MITKNDLDDFLLQSYVYNLNAIGKDDTWGEVALNMKPLDSWRKYNGFNLFRNAGFIKQVNSKMKGYNCLTIDDVLTIEDEHYNRLQDEIRELRSSISSVNVSEDNVRKIEQIANNLLEYKRNIDKMRDYLNDIQPKLNALLENEKNKNDIKIEPLLEKLNIVWASYQRNADSQMRIIELERKIAVLEERLGE